MHGQHACAPHPVERTEFAGLEDDLEMRVAAGLLDGRDLVEDEAVIAGEERAARDHHVDLIGALIDRHARIFEFHVERRLAARKGRRDRRDVDSAALERLARDAHHRGIYADGRDVRQAGHRIVQVHRLLAQLPHLAGRVLALERRQVDHRQHHPERLDLGCFLDRATLEPGDTLVDADFVDARHAVQVRQIPPGFDGRQAHDRDS